MNDLGRNGNQIKSLSVCNGKSSQKQQVLPATGEEEADYHCACLSVQCWAFCTRVFSAELMIDNGIKDKVVSSSFPCHWGKNDAPSISSSLTCTGLCIVIPLLLWRASSLSLYFTSNSQGVPWGFWGGWRFCWQLIALHVLHAFLLSA